VNDLVRVLGLAQPQVSKHLREALDLLERAASALATTRPRQR
jgi:hypothetical protein